MDNIENYNQNNIEGIRQWYDYIEGIRRWLSNTSIAWDYANRFAKFPNGTRFIKDFNYNIGYTIKTNQYGAYVYIFKMNLKPEEFGLKEPPINDSYNRLDRIITETLRNYTNKLLNEGRNADKAIAKAKEVIRNFFHNASWLDTEFVNPQDNPNHLSSLDYMEDHCREDFGFHANIPDAVIRLYPIITKIAFELGFQQSSPDITKLNRLTNVVEYIKANYKKPDFPILLNKLTLENTTYDFLNDMFGGVIDAQMKADNERANSRGNDSQMNTNYDILVCDSYEMANKYGNYSCSNSKLCYTQSENTWNSYTKDGTYKVYLLLRKDWKNVPEEHRENTPYDDYGLSMIFLFINPDGDIAYSNTRWNHNTNGQGSSNVDQSFTKTMISDLLNVNFDSVFKPYTEEELRAKDIMTVAYAKKLLAQGVDPKKIFSRVYNFH